MMMMTHASDRDERQEEREERRQEFHLQIEMQHQQMQAQQNMMTMIMMTMMGHSVQFLLTRVLWTSCLDRVLASAMKEKVTAVMNIMESNYTLTA
jgi:hypothetical protein